MRWLESMTPEGMKTGNGTRELRLDEAKKATKAAGVTVEELIQKYNIKL